MSTAIGKMCLEETIAIPQTQPKKEKKKKLDDTNLSVNISISFWKKNKIKFNVILLSNLPKK